ncbi:MAG: diphthamide biosynthesis enzyme Dph2 [archaeon]
MPYELELEKIKKKIKELNSEKILVQLPEGLKTNSKKIIDELRKDKNLEIILDGETVYGACCIPNEDERKKYDLIIHFGHTELVPADNVIYLPVKSKKSVKEITEKAGKKAKGEKIGITTTTQHLHKLKEMKEAVKRCGKEPVTREEDGFIKEGQVLGCCFVAATEIQDEVDSFIFIGSGKFHPKGIASSTKKKVIQGNPYNNELEKVEPGEWEKEKEIRKDKARNAESFAVIETPHPGQTSNKITQEIKKKLIEKDKKVYVIKMNQITPNKINHLPFDAFIINACPRIVLDDWKNYEKPVLLSKEVEELIGF